MLIQRRLTALVLLLCLAFMTACGASARTKTLRVNLIALNTTRDLVRALSNEHEKQIFDACNPPACTQEQGHAQVNAWRVKVDKAIEALDTGYRAVHDAALLDDAASTRDAAKAVTAALTIYQDLKEKL